MMMRIQKKCISKSKSLNITRWWQDRHGKGLVTMSSLNLPTEWSINELWWSEQGEQDKLMIYSWRGPDSGWRNMYFWKNYNRNEKVKAAFILVFCCFAGNGYSPLLQTSNHCHKLECFIYRIKEKGKPDSMLKFTSDYFRWSIQILLGEELLSCSGAVSKY